MRAGLGSIVPLQLLTTLSPLEMELRTCGLPYINLEFLKVSAGAGRAGKACPGTSCAPAPSSSHVREAVLIPISQLSNLKLRHKSLAQVHTASKWQSQTLYPDHLLPELRP